MLFKILVKVANKLRVISCISNLINLFNFYFFWMFRCVAIDDEAKIECFEEKCGQLTDCRGMPLTIKGRCCPVCSGILIVFINFEFIFKLNLKWVSVNNSM